MVPGGRLSGDCQKEGAVCLEPDGNIRGSLLKTSDNYLKFRPGETI